MTVIEKHSRMPRKFVPAEPESTETRLTVQGKPVPQEAKEKVLNDAKELILQGFTLKQIADKHGISDRTLEYWLHALGDEYKALRQAWIDGLLHEAGELLKDSDESGNAPFRLARARELWKRATWYAERRDRERYGEEKTGPILVNPVLNIVVGQQQERSPITIENVESKG
jgi:transcriptional regulator with XRE-family HTH domain